MTEENKAVIGHFKDAVNMTAGELTTWLRTDEAQEVGQKRSEDAESTGHQSGRHIIDLLHKKQAEYSEDDFHQMRRIVGYVHRHLAQKPSGDIEHTHWRYSLMNWGHDPLKGKTHHSSEE